MREPKEKWNVFYWNSEHLYFSFLYFFDDFNTIKSFFSLYYQSIVTLIQLKLHRKIVDGLGFYMM